MPLQDWIHKVEQGGSHRFLKVGLVLLVFMGLVFSYNFRQYKNMSNPEAMDAAQLARNIAEGRGYTTLFVRPLSMYLLEKTYVDKHGQAAVADMSDRSQLRGMHPDLANPPLYPVLLAVMMKILPPSRYQNANASGIWSHVGGGGTYDPDFYISLLNQSFFLASIVLLFFLARRLFDAGVAWMSAALFLGTDLFWRFSISGLSTMLLILIFLGLAWCLTLLAENSREAVVSVIPGIPAPLEPEADPAKWSHGRIVGVAGCAGALVGLGALTRYSLGWLIVPVVLYLAIFMGRDGVATGLAAFVAFAALLTPWMVRNYHISHTPFGTAGFSVYEATPLFPEFRLERSLHPNFSPTNKAFFGNFWFKLLGNVRHAIQEGLPQLGGNWVTAFFLVGLLVPFRNRILSRLRWFAVFCLPVLIIAQGLGSTHLSEEYPAINSENLLVLVTPLVIMFGVSLFFILLDQMNLPFPEFRSLVIFGFGAVTCLPMILAVGSPRLRAVAYPPYHPPTIQRTSNWMNPDELMMSDIPWAVAWYGKRQCVWLTLNAQEDFYNIYDFRKPVSAVYLTPETMDSKFLSQWIRASEHSWGRFVVESVMLNQLPANFPLRQMPSGFMPEQLFLTDRKRWMK